MSAAAETPGGTPPPKEGFPPAVLAAGLGALLVAPAAATIYLSFEAGGFFPATVGFAVILGLQLLLLRTLLADRPFEGFRWRLAVPAAGLAGLALWQLLSATWSESSARALLEFDRTLLYLVALTLGGAVARTGTRLGWMLRALFAAMAFVCLAGLASRVVPDVVDVALSGFNDRRLAYPLTYWNALGIFAGVALVLGFHLTTTSREPVAVRLASAALLPPIAATLLLTYSRGALAAAAVGLVAYVVAGRPRAFVTGAVATVPAVLLAVMSAYDAELISDAEALGTDAAVSQGHDVAVTVGIAMLLALALRAALLPVDARLARWRAPGLRSIGVPPWAGWVAAAVVVLVVALAAGAPGKVERQWDKFIEGGGQGPQVEETRDRLTDPAGGGRGEQWGIALDAFADEPLKGFGAGMYETRYYRDREESLRVTDGHSLYLETMGDLGVVGLVLVLLAVGGILAGVAAGIRGRQRSRYAAIFAAGLAWAVHAGTDWDWEMPAVSLWFFALGAAALAARPRPEARPMSTRLRAPIGIALLVSAVAPFLLMTSSGRLEEASAALGDRDCRTARTDAMESLDYLANRPEPYATIALCDVVLGFPEAGIEAAQKAIDRDPAHWEWHFHLAIATAAAGRDPSAAFARAQQLNPLDGLLREEAPGFAPGAGRRAWTQAGTSTADRVFGGGRLTIDSL